jgi:hypothetical protein
VDQFSVKEVLLQLIKAEQEKYPFSLKAKMLPEIMNCEIEQIYRMLAKGEIPGAQKIKGLGWRINRDVLLTWLYSENEREVKIG